MSDEMVTQSTAVRSRPPLMQVATGLRPAVFIGGASRTGSSLLGTWLGTHPEILNCPFETSFLIVSNGVMDVVRAVSDEYSPDRLDVILHEFERLMRHHLCSPRSYPFNGFDLASYFGHQRYERAITTFLARLDVVRYPGHNIHIEPYARFGSIHSPSLRRLRLPARLRQERTYILFCERQSRKDALAAARGLVDDLFGAKALEERALVWSEVTTANQQFADFLLSIAPHGLYINTVRDPLDVAVAHAAQDWAPKDFEKVCKNVRGRYERWQEVRARLSPKAFVEVRFEELVAEPELILRVLCDIIGVGYDARMLGWRPEQARLRPQLPGLDAVELDTFRRILGPVSDQLGYPVP